MISMFAVASSIITTLFFLRIDLQMQISCFSPELKLPPFSAISRSSPFLTAAFSLESEPYLANTSDKPARSRSSRISLSSLRPWGSMLKRKVPVNKVGS